ncbi:MAG: HvfC/BufC family peptide modification chaperone [Lysobacterales bacterium]
MPSLRELQDAVRRSMIEHDDAAAVRHIVAAGIAPQERLSVYRNTFTQTLIRALRLSYPAVDRLVGAEFFDAAARDFIVQQPPRSGYLDEFGGDFAAFLERFAPAASVPYLGDVARLEWAVSRALHAPDAEPLAIASLGSVDAADHARICFAPHPSVGLVHTVFPADVIWRAVLDDDEAALAAIDLSGGPAWLLVQRGPSGVDIARLDETLWHFVGALCAGCPLGLALDDHPGIDAPAALADLLAHGRVVGFGLAPHADRLQPSMRLS